MIKRICQNCGKEFLAWDFRVKEGNAKYCSRNCFNFGHWKNPTPKMIEHTKKVQKIAWEKRLGSKHTETSKKKISDSRKGKCLGNKNPKYKGGGIDFAGYWKICVNGKQIRQARYVMEQKLGRKLQRFEDTHHLDGNKLNDNPENLIILEKQKHTKLHFEQNPNEFRKRYE